MPLEEHRIIKRLAKKKGLVGESKKSYIFGTLRKIKLRREKKHA